MKYKIFLWAFIISVIAGVTFFIFYVRAIFSFTRSAYNGYEPEPYSIIETIFTPAVVISLVILILTGLCYRILAIVWIAKNNIITGGEKAIWIIGFILLGFVTAIVFLILAKSRRLIEGENSITYTG